MRLSDNPALAGTACRVFEIAAFMPILRVRRSAGFSQKKETPGKTWGLFFVQLNEFSV
jgi:hypothetical protein